MKRFELIMYTDGNENDYCLNMENDGYSALEVLGLLDIAKIKVLEKLANEYDAEEAFY